jgi:hypothetical protein
MQIILAILLSSQATDSGAIALSRRFNRIECYSSKLYLSQRIGQSIARFVSKDSLDLISITDEINYRIYDFKIAPFAIYINRGTALEKFFLNSGRKEVIFISRDISSFSLTPDDEIVLGDRQTHELIFLDFTYKVKFKVENINIEDIQWHDTLIYALTANRILIYDEYGNLIDKMKTPEPCNRMVVDDHDMLIFTEQNNYLYRAGVEWRRIELPFVISDICMKKDIFIILDGSRNYLHSYSRDDF